MYRPSAYAIDDAAVLHEVMRSRVFATIAAAAGGRVRFAYAPVMPGVDGTVRFHLARGNPLAGLPDGARVALSMLAADCYVSPDWYRDTVTVPTWNYIALEGEGALRRLAAEDLRAFVIALSAQEEDKLAPKPPWLIGKVPEARQTALLNGIVGFSLTLDRLEGKFKLSQDKTSGDLRGVIGGLEARGDPASLAVARAMRRTSFAP